MPLEVLVKFFRPQNTAGVSKEKGIAGTSQTIVVNGKRDANVKKIKIKNDKTIKCLHTVCSK